MDKTACYVMNDLVDVLKKLTEVVRELNPGADLSFADFLLVRAGRVINETYDALEQS